MSNPSRDTQMHDANASSSGERLDHPAILVYPSLRLFLLACKCLTTRGSLVLLQCLTTLPLIFFHPRDTVCRIPPRMYNPMPKECTTFLHNTTRLRNMLLRQHRWAHHRCLHTQCRMGIRQRGRIRSERECSRTKSVDFVLKIVTYAAPSPTGIPSSNTSDGTTTNYAHNFENAIVLDLLDDLAPHVVARGPALGRPYLMIIGLVHALVPRPDLHPLHLATDPRPLQLLLLVLTVEIFKHPSPKTILDDPSDRRVPLKTRPTLRLWIVR